MSSPLYVGARVQLVALAARHRIAASYDNRIIVADGGLMSYGPDTNDMWRRAATYVHKILKGAKPADLPIEQAATLVRSVRERLLAEDPTSPPTQIFGVTHSTARATRSI